MSPKIRATVERRTLAEQVYASLKKAIVTGELRPGERLKELELSRMLGASRTPIREALTWLQQEGLVRPLPIVGLTVAELSEADMHEIFGLLVVLESYAARLAAERITEKQLDKLQALCDQAEELDDDRLSEVNWRFHELLVESSGHRRLQAIIKNLRTSMQPYRAMTLTSADFRSRSVSDHREILALLRSKATAQLEALMAKHLEIAREVTVHALRERALRFAVEAFPDAAARIRGRRKQQ